MDAEDTSDGKMRYFQQLSSTLAAFSESVDMDDVMVSYVMSQEDRLGKLSMEYSSSESRSNVSS